MEQDAELFLLDDFVVGYGARTNKVISFRERWNKSGGAGSTKHMAW
jgi:hypothetical protein